MFHSLLWLVLFLGLNVEPAILSTHVQELTTVSGTVSTEEGEGVSNVIVQLQNPGDPNFPISTQTDSDGYYEFNNVQCGQDYYLSLERDGDYLNGVSTLDQVIIHKHILKLESLGSGGRVLAADVNFDQKVNVFDLVVLRLLILGVYNEFPESSSWHFIYNPPDSFDDNPFNSIVNEIVIRPQPNENTFDFLGIKIGDVTGNAIPN